MYGVKRGWMGKAYWAWAVVFIAIALDFAPGGDLLCYFRAVVAGVLLSDDFQFYVLHLHVLLSQ